MARITFIKDPVVTSELCRYDFFIDGTHVSVRFFKLGTEYAAVKTHIDLIKAVLDEEDLCTVLGRVSTAEGLRKAVYEWRLLQGG